MSFRKSLLYLLELYAIVREYLLHYTEFSDIPDYKLLLYKRFLYDFEIIQYE